MVEALAIVAGRWSSLRCISLFYCLLLWNRGMLCQNALIFLFSVPKLLSQDLYKLASLSYLSIPQSLFLPLPPDWTLSGVVNNLLFVKSNLTSVSVLLNSVWLLMLSTCSFILGLLLVSMTLYSFVLQTSRKMLLWLCWLFPLRPWPNCEFRPKLLFQPSARLHLHLFHLVIFNDHPYL